jgi:hypothetical protein
MFHGMENRNLSRKDRISLLSRSQVMYINGASEAEIQEFAQAFSAPRVQSFPIVGPEFSQLMGALGYLSVLILLSFHLAGL